jgi:hypothetical protein
MTDLQPSFNCRYFVDHAARVGGRILDYGCGAGKIVAPGLDRGLDIWRADTFPGYYGAWASLLEPRIRERMETIPTAARMIRAGSIGTRYFGDPIGPVRIRK